MVTIFVVEYVKKKLLSTDGGNIYGSIPVKNALRFVVFML